MPITASGGFTQTFLNALSGGTALNLTLTTAKWALFSNSVTTPNFDATTAQYGSAPFNANEVTGTNWATGGVAVTTPALAIGSGGTAGRFVFTAGNISVASATFTGARGALLYTAAAGNPAVVLINFGSDASPSAGTFSVTWGSYVFAIACS